MVVVYSLLWKILSCWTEEPTSENHEETLRKQKNQKKKRTKETNGKNQDFICIIYTTRWKIRLVCPQSTNEYLSLSWLISCYRFLLFFFYHSVNMYVFAVAPCYQSTLRKRKKMWIMSLEECGLAIRQTDVIVMALYMCVY